VNRKNISSNTSLDEQVVRDRAIRLFTYLPYSYIFLLDCFNGHPTEDDLMLSRIKRHMNRNVFIRLTTSKRRDKIWQTLPVKRSG
jgi:hypothetical protein